MIIAVDETGSFRADRDLDFGLTTLVTITDKTWIDFAKFMENQFGKTWIELKGKLLEFEDREKILKFIGKHNEVKYVSYLYDLNFGHDESVIEHQHIQADKFLVENVHPNMKKELGLLRNQMKNLSVADYSIFILTLELFIEWKRYFQFDYVFTNTSRDNWTLYHFIDTQNKPGRFLKLLRDCLILTTNELNPNYSVFTPKEWTLDHPYSLRHCVDGDINKENDKAFYEHLKIGNELEDPYLFLPDLIGHTILRSIERQSEKKWLKVLKRLRVNRSMMMNNKFVKSKENYYLVRGFDRSKNRDDVTEKIRSHYALLKSLD